MNKKFFAALMASGMLMGSPMGVLAAEEMVEVEAGAVGGTDVEQASEVKVDEVNFPDENFRNAVITAVNNLGTDNKPTPSLVAGKSVKTAALADIVTLGSLSGSNTSSEPDTDLNNPADTKPFKDLTGIEYLTGLQSLVLTNSPQLKVADLTDNEELVTVVLAPKANYNATTPEVIAPADKDSSDLYSITLPEETANLTNLVIEGASQLTTLDLSSYDSLEFVDLQNNELAQLNVEGCAAINSLNVSGNDLTGLDVSTLKALNALTATHNNLYELELPSGKNLTTVDVSGNKLPTIDVSSLRNLETLDVSDNRLESIDVSSNTTIQNLNVGYNHLAALDLSKNSNIKNSSTSYDPTATKTLTVSPQYLYANAPDAGIDLASYDENFQANSNDLGWLNDDTATPTKLIPTGGSINKTGIFEFNSNIEPKAEVVGTDDSTTGISYYYAIGAAPVAGNNNVMTVYIAQADLMNRLYNPNSGEHFYTADLNEKDTLVKLGWQAEGIGWIAPQENYPTQPIEAGAAVFRLYNPNAGDHHYTSDSKEKDTLVRAGWNYEGVGWYSGKIHNDNPTSVKADGTPETTSTMKAYTIQVYREYNPNAKEAGAHNYTTSENENDTLVALGWLDEGIGWWALK